MSHLTSLLMCLMSAVNNVAALQNVRSSMPEAGSGPPPWEQRYGAAPPKSFQPPRPDGIQGPQAPSSVIDPKSFSIEFQGPSDQDSGSSQVYSGKSDHQKKHPKDSANPGFNLKFSFPFMPTTEAPTTKSEKNIFRYLGSSQGKVYAHPLKYSQKPDHQHPHKQTQLVKVLDQLLQGGSHEPSGQAQQDKVVFKPLIQHQLPHSHPIGSFSSPYIPYAASGTHAPVYQSPHHTPKWLPVHKPHTSDDDVKKSISQYVQNINGKLMIPLDKCPGFEKYEEYLKGYYHQHGQFPYGYIHQHGPFPHGYIHQHGQPPKVHIHQQGKLPHVHVYQHGKPSHVHVDQHGPNSHSHIYKPWTPAPTTVAKPNYAEYYQYGGMPAPNPSEPTQEPSDYLKWWLNKYQGGHQQHPKPGHTHTYVYQEPDKQQQQPGDQTQYFYYKVPATSIPYYTPGWR